MNLNQLKICIGYPDLTIRQLAVLFVVEKKTLKLYEIAAVLGVPKPAITRAFDGLVKNGFLRRQRYDVEDNRQVYGEITDEGEKLLRRICHDKETNFTSPAIKFYEHRANFGDLISLLKTASDIGYDEWHDVGKHAGFYKEINDTLEKYGVKEWWKK